MLKISGSKITINRGDTAFITVNVRDREGNPYELQEGDGLWFAVKHKATDENYAIAPKRLNGNVLELMSEDTINLDFGTYIYDVQLINSRGYTSTIIQPSDFVVALSITAAGDR
jgi:hypothetical protein